MTARRPDWSLVREIFEGALAQPAERRQSFVEESCAGQRPLYDEVAALLAAHDRAAVFLETPAVELLDDSPREARGDHADPHIGQVIGPYSIESCIGHGGMGTVYLARRADRAFERRVAIKMISRGRDSAVVVRRFEHERQILASLDHPHIARLYDGGTTADGLPYFVMEYVEGEPITQYCNRHRLGTAARLRMFRTVCAAVHYAHQNLVVHRDLKPANILVGASGQPALLDFGIARLLAGINVNEPEGATLASALTPDYASPEQVRGQTMTTATDVYSLGVVLYELLAGRRPFSASAGSLEEIVRSVCVTDPAPPSAAFRPAADALASPSAKELRGDLDTIVLKALRKEPELRYASAEALSDDIGRYLEGRPVRARGDALAYRARKFATRHLTAVLAAAVFILSLVAGAALIVRQSQIANEQRNRAERRFADVRKLAGSFLFEVQDAIQYLPGATRARQLVTTRALEYLDSLAAEASGDPSLQAELAHAYRRMADVLGNAREANLGDVTGALASYNKALALQEALVEQQPSNRALQRDLGRTLLGIGDVLITKIDHAAALASYRRSLSIGERLAADAPGDRDLLRMVAAAHYGVGDVLRLQGKGAEALESLREAVVILERLSGDASDRESRRLLARGFKRLGNVRVELGDVQESVAFLQRALALNEALAAADPLNTSLRNEVAMSQIDLGRAYLHGNRPADALREYRGAEAITRSMAAADPSNAQTRWLNGLQLNSIGYVLTALHREDEAVASHMQALALLTVVARADPANETYQYNLANTHQLIGDAYQSAAARAAPAAAKQEAARSACAAYRRSGEVFDAMRRRGTLTTTIVGDADSVAAALTRCEPR
jgi:non-specific serine/threonine protein kinase/serine/threonine-protein kinase